MKKIFTLVIALGAMTAVFAQRNESRDIILGQPNTGIYNDHGYNNSYGYHGIRERDEEIRRINNEYNWRIESLKHDRYLRNGERRRQIRFLENERDARIREVMNRYNHYNNRDYRRERY